MKKTRKTNRRVQIIVKRVRKRKRTLTAAGWPRPWTRDHQYPVPWTTAMETLGKNDKTRHKEAATGSRCQLCGVEFKRRQRVYIFIRDPKHWYQTRPRGLGPGEVHAMDKGMLHRRCAVLALAYCPHLIKRRRRGTLAMFTVPAHAGWQHDSRVAKWQPLPRVKKSLNKSCNVTGL